MLTGRLLWFLNRQYADSCGRAEMRQFFAYLSGGHQDAEARLKSYAQECSKFMARVLIIIPYRNLFPPRGGGMLRAFHLLCELARVHEVHAVLLQPESELKEMCEGYEFPSSIRVYGPTQTPPPRKLFDLLPPKVRIALHYRWLQRSWRGPADITLLQTYHLISHVLRTQWVDMVIFTALNGLFLARFVKRLCPYALRIANLENVEHHLLAQRVEHLEVAADQHDESSSRYTQKSLKRNYEMVRRRESNLASVVDAFFACSDEDREVLSSLNDRQIPGFTVANGVDTTLRKFDGRVSKSASREILFCGTLNYLPNRDGLIWFHEKIWPLILARLPDVRLVIIGRGAKSEDFSGLRADSSIDFIGAVEDVTPYYHRTGVAVVPLQMGSGTRLKVLEAMSLGNPIVSTRIGAEGIGVVDGEHILLEDEPEMFCEAVVQLISNATAFEQIRQRARQFVENKYDWMVVGDRMNSAIAELLQTRESSHDHQ